MWSKGLIFGAIGLSHLARADIIQNPNKAYDYVIVGSGAGGGPLAARLATLGHNVLLIDAGDDQTQEEIYRNPALNLPASEYKNMSWEFYVNHYSDPERQKQDSKMVYRLPDGRKFVGRNAPAEAKPLGIFYPRAGSVGGCTTHNAMFTVLPPKRDWNEIAEMTGDSSWSADNMRRMFERIERCNYRPQGTPGHGYDGWLSTLVSPVNLTQSDLQLRAQVTSAMALSRGGKCVSSTHNLVALEQRDLNSADRDRDFRTGGFMMPLSVNGKERSGPVDAIKAVLADASRSDKLDILFNALVTRVRMAHGPNGLRATGVEYVRGQSLYRADPRASLDTSQPLPPRLFIRAMREVVVSGGAFNTPQILKLSGIGPRDELRRFRIPVLVDLPGVGTNLRDRYESTVVSQADNFTGRFAMAVMKRSSVAEHGIPDILVTETVTNFLGYYPSYSKLATASKRFWSIIVLKAFSRNRAGMVRLQSPDPRDTPRIDFHYFDEGTNGDQEGDKDAQALLEGMQWARAAARRASLKIPFRDTWPPQQAVASTASLREFVKAEAWGHHASCTCPIGAKNDPMAVLDSRFRVRGVSNLRVVDASVFP